MTTRRVFTELCKWRKRGSYEKGIQREAGTRTQGDHIWHMYIMQAEDANVIRSGCHGDLMFRSDGLL